MNRLRHMNSIFFAFNKFLLFISVLLIPTLCSANAETVFRNNNRAVVVVTTYNDEGYRLAQGSGFIVKSDGVIVTNYHVIRNASRVEVKVDGRTLDIYGFIYKDRGNDLVILKSKAENLPTVHLGSSDTLSVGEKVYVIGSPQGLENTISEGILSGIRRVSLGLNILQITAPISPGSSGGPVFNEKGEVIGIATAYLRGGQNLNLAMPVNIIKNNFSNQKVIPIKKAVSHEQGEKNAINKLFKIQKIPVVKVSASSAHYNEPHMPDMAVDGNVFTCWSPYKRDTIRSWIKFEFEEEKLISKFTIINGWIPEDKQSHKDIFFQSHRVKKMTAHYDNGEKEIINLKDTNKRQTVISQVKTKTKSVKLVVEKIYKAKTGYKNVLAISEVTFYE